METAEPKDTLPRIVLVVDDDDDVRTLAVLLFEELGFTVRAAASGAEALALLEADPGVAVLFSDVRMPGMNGVELAREARRRRPALRIVLTSAYIGGAAIRDIDFLPKPYRMGDLERTLEAGPAAV